MEASQPKINIVVVQSTVNTELVSLRVLMMNGKLSGSDFRRQLTEAGFKPGDKAVLMKVDEEITARVPRKNGK